MITTLLTIAFLFSLALVLRAALSTLHPASAPTSEPTAEDYETYLNAMKAAFQTTAVPTLPRAPRKPRNPIPKDKALTDNTNPNNRTVPKNTSRHKSPSKAESQISLHLRPLAVTNNLPNICLNPCSSVVLSPSKPKQVLLTLYLAPFRLATCFAKLAALPVLIIAVLAIGLFTRKRPLPAASQTKNHAA
jgi:hypothetical protein